MLGPLRVLARSIRIDAHAMRSLGKVPEQAEVIAGEVADEGAGIADTCSRPS
jgi:hypothetical protein